MKSLNVIWIRLLKLMDGNMFECSEREKETLSHMKNPQSGDHFHEMFAFHMIVLQTDKNHFIYLEGHGGDTIPNDCKLTICTYQEFHDRFQYDSDKMKDRYWIDYSNQYSQEFVDGCLDYFKTEIENYVRPEDGYQTALYECLGIGIGE